MTIELAFPQPVQFIHYDLQSPVVTDFHQMLHKLRVDAQLIWCTGFHSERRRRAEGSPYLMVGLHKWHAAVRRYVEDPQETGRVRLEIQPPVSKLRSDLISIRDPFSN